MGRGSAAAICTVVLLGVALSPVRGTAAPLSQPSLSLTAEDAESYLDGFFAEGLQRADVAGAVVVVVKDGRVLLEKGYGYADIDTRKPVDPDRTLFRPGSISKLFTWTAVMQLVEQRKLDLDRDVNDYLDFRIPDAFGKPITLRNLMTHSAGFEEELKDWGTEDPSRMMSLRAVAARTPTRIYPPGERTAYSNYGASLAGYIVQRVSGERFEDYVARHIFAPLGMTHATFVEPLPAAMRPDMSRGYQLPEDGAQKLELISMSPAAGLSATGGDIARFMMAHLNNGSYDGGTILKPDTAIAMHRTAFQPTPPLPGMALGFYHEDRNGHDIIGHDGDTRAFHSDLHLILDANVGLFVSLNSAGHETSPISNLRSRLFDGFMNRYFPGVAAPVSAVQFPSARADGEKLAGFYALSRRSETNFMSVSALLIPIQISVAADGSLNIPALRALGGPTRWIEVGPFSWIEPREGHCLVARVEDGRPKWISMDLFPPIMVLQPISFWRSSFFVGPLVATSLLMVLLTTIFWPVKAVVRWRHSRDFSLSGRSATLYRLARLAALIDAVAILGWVAFLAAGQSNILFFSSANDGLLRLLQVLALLAIAGAILPILQFADALRDSKRVWWTKVTDGLLAIATLSIAWFFFAFHFVTLSLNY
jgi:CubicO group peptidase (beta-lactamase class C family)